MHCSKLFRKKDHWRRDLQQCTRASTQGDNSIRARRERLQRSKSCPGMSAESGLNYHLDKKTLQNTSRTQRLGRRGRSTQDCRYNLQLSRSPAGLRRTDGREMRPHRRCRMCLPGRGCRRRRPRQGSAGRRCRPRGWRCRLRRASSCCCDRQCRRQRLRASGNCLQGSAGRWSPWRRCRLSLLWRSQSGRAAGTCQARKGDSARRRSLLRQAGTDTAAGRRAAQCSPRDCARRTVCRQ
jgi:hypothetical protein